MAAKNKILIFLGTVRPQRMADRVAFAVRDLVTSHGMEPELIDPLDIPLELVKAPLFFMKDPEKEAPKGLLDLNKKIQNADGFIMVSAEYNCSIPPALSNMLDHITPDSFRHRPCGIVTYSIGSFGGIRSTMILRPFISELKMISVPFSISIPMVQDAIDESGKCSPRIHKNLVKLVKEVAWYADALKNHKKVAPEPHSIKMEIDDLMEAGVM